MAWIGLTWLAYNRIDEWLGARVPPWQFVALLGPVFAYALLWSLSNEQRWIATLLAASLAYEGAAKSVIRTPLLRPFVRPGIGSIALVALLLRVACLAVGPEVSGLLLLVAGLWLGVALPFTVHFVVRRELTVLVVDHPTPVVALVLTTGRAWFVGSVLIWAHVDFDWLLRHSETAPPGDPRAFWLLIGFSLAFMVLTIGVFAALVAPTAWPQMHAARTACMLVAGLVAALIVAVIYGFPDGLAMSYVDSLLQGGVIFIAVGPSWLSLRPSFRAAG